MNFFWMIESGPENAPIYLGMIDENPYWTFDLSKVAKFATEEAAQNFMDAMISKSPLIDYRIAEHGVEANP